MDDTMVEAQIDEREVAMGLAEGAAHEDMAPDGSGEAMPSVTEVLAQLEERGIELADARAALAQRDAELQGLRQQLDTAVEEYREAVLSASPEVPRELVAGATIAEIEASLQKARATVERIRSRIESQIAEQRVPAGAPIRTTPDVSALSAQEKIAHGLAQRGG